MENVCVKCHAPLDCVKDYKYYDRELDRGIIGTLWFCPRCDEEDERKGIAERGYFIAEGLR